jgi:hypothetical protein
VVDIAMVPDIVAMEEVVVVGYAPQKKMDMTGAVSTVAVPAEKDNADYQAAEPSIGYPAFKEYIEQNLSFPEGATLERAVVVLNFTIPSGGGHPRDITVLKSPGADFSREAIRLMENGPSWKPAIAGGQAVQSGQRVRIVFKR